MNEEYLTRSQNTGRWTVDEKNLFNLAYQWHGKDWQKLSQAIPTRNIKQIRSHVQKYEKNIHKNHLNNLPPPKVFILDSAVDELTNYITQLCSRSYRRYVECQHQLINSKINQMAIKFAFSPVKGKLSHN